MRSFLAILVPAVLTLSSSALAEQASADVVVEPVSAARSQGRNNRITISPMHVAFGNVPIEYERALSDRFSIAITPSLITPGVGLVLNYYALGVQLTTALRYFPMSTQRLEGLWIGPELFGKLNVNNWSGPTLGAGLGAMAGYTMISRSGFTASAGFGLGLGLGISGRGLIPVPRVGVNLNLGYAF